MIIHKLNLFRILNNNIVIILILPNFYWAKNIKTSSFTAIKVHEISYTCRPKEISRKHYIEQMLHEIRLYYVHFMYTIYDFRDRNIL